MTLRSIFLNCTLGVSALMAGAAALISALSAIGVLPHAVTIREPSPVALPQPQSCPPTPSFHVAQLQRDQFFLVDSRSGRVWERVCSGKTKGADCDGLLIWNEMYVSGVTPPESAATRVFAYQHTTQQPQAKAPKPQNPR